MSAPQDSLASALVVSKRNDIENDIDDDQFMIFDHKKLPRSGKWYILPASGHTPLARVGHAGVFLPSGDEKCNGYVISVGGANPDGTFSEINILNLDSLRWDLMIPPGFKPRYEHTAFCLPQTVFRPETEAKVYVFGGADMVDNMDDVQMIDLNKKTSDSLQNVKGSKPSPRTYRCQSSLGSSLFVFGGGRQGSDPVTDKQCRVFDLESNTWTSLDTKGQPPKIRQGHSCVAICYENEEKNQKKCLVVHGGMAGTSFYDDLHILNLDTLQWQEVKFSRSKPKPSPRAAHVALPYKFVLPYSF